MVHLLTHAVHPPHSSLASLKDTGTEPFFTLADHTTSHRHTQTQHTNSHTWRWDCALIVGVRASVPSTPWTRGWHHSVLGIINGGKDFQGNSGPHSFRSPWGKDCDGSLISSELSKTVQRLTDIWHMYTMCMSACTRVRVCLRVSSSCNSSNNSAVFFLSAAVLVFELYMFLFFNNIAGRHLKNFILIYPLRCFPSKGKQVRNTSTDSNKQIFSGSSLQLSLSLNISPFYFSPHFSWGWTKTHQQ